MAIFSKILYYGPMVKRSRHRPFTAVTRVRFPDGSPESRQTQKRLPAFPLFRGREKERYGLWRAGPNLCLEDLAERKSAKQELQKAKRKFRQGSAPGAADRWPGRLAAGRTRAGPPSAKMLAKSRRLCYARNEKRRKGKVRQECAFAENFTQTCFYAVGV